MCIMQNIFESPPPKEGELSVNFIILDLDIKSFLSKSYVLTHSESIDMHIEKCLKRHLIVSIRKKGFCRAGGAGWGGGSNVLDMSETTSFF